jgi:APA family basic amino acid/polyamine antiporter
LELKRQIGLSTAVLIIIADVIGTGIFITTGEVLGITSNALSVLILFGVGGLIAITGSLCYAELATMWPDDGGEYVYLKRIYGILPSFLTGWISMFIGFSLAAAMSAITAVNYINKLSPGGVATGDWAPKLLAGGIILFFGIVHLLGVRKGSTLQNILTLLKLLIVFLFIVLGFYLVDWKESARLTAVYTSGGNSVLEYGAALIIIMYAYSGWNGTTYIAGELKDPGRNLPRAMFFAALLVAVIYILLNIVYIMASPGGQIISEGKYTIGALTASSLVGTKFSIFFNISIILILLSSVSVQVMIGPRVTLAMAQDKTIFGALGRINPKLMTPDLAIVIQVTIAVIYVFIGFDVILKMLIYMGFALSIFPLMAVIGMVYMRYKEPDAVRPFRVPFFPAVPFVYIILTILIIIATLITKTIPALFAIGMVTIGVIIFFVWKYFVRKAQA